MLPVTGEVAMDNFVQFVPTKRGGVKLVVNNYHFRIKRSFGNKKYWSCIDSNCNVTAITEGEILQNGDLRKHNHAPLEFSVQKSQFIDSLKRRAIELPNDTASKVYQDVLNNVPLHDVCNLPTYNSCKNTVYRCKRNLVPALPKTLQEINLVTPWNTLPDGRLFLLIDDGLDNRIMVFGTVDNLRRICSDGRIWMDGTFYIAPFLFYQLYTLHTKVDTQCFPQLFCLLPNKTEDTYVRLLNLIKNKALEFNMLMNPTKVVIDFEIAMLNAVITVFNIIPKGCVFHFNQCIYRKIQNLGLAANYNRKNPIELYTWARRIMTLPFVPPGRLDCVFNYIQQSAPVDFNIQTSAMHAYLNETYLDQVGALFSREVWNHYNEQDRTNNVCEGFHSKINRRIHHAHPNIFQFVNLIKEEQMYIERTIRQVLNGAQQAKKAKYVRCENRISSLIDRTFNRGIVPNLLMIMEYVDAVSHQVWGHNGRE